MDAKTRLGLVTVSLLLGFICWGGVYLHASLVNMLADTIDLALTASDVFSAFFSMFMIFIFAYGVLVSIEVVLNIRGCTTTSLIQQKSEFDHDNQKHDLARSTFLKSWATLLVLLCWVGLYYHTGVLVKMWKRSTAPQGFFEIFFLLLFAFSIIFIFFLGIASVVIMTYVRRKKVSYEKRKSEDSAPVPDLHFRLVN